MDMFIVRVELHNRVQGDYSVLHAAMAELGFLRTIQGEDGVWYDLPTAMYFIRSARTAESLREIVRGAADRTGRAYDVFVMETPSIAWFGRPTSATNRLLALFPA